MATTVMATALRSARGATTLMRLMLAPPMVITGLAGSWAASLSAPDLGIAGTMDAAVTTAVAGTMVAVDTVE